MKLTQVAGRCFKAYFEKKKTGPSQFPAQGNKTD